MDTTTVKHKRQPRGKYTKRRTRPGGIARAKQISETDPELRSRAGKACLKKHGKKFFLRLSLLAREAKRKKQLAEQGADK